MMAFGDGGEDEDNETWRTLEMRGRLVKSKALLFTYLLYSQIIKPELNARI